MKRRRSSSRLVALLSVVVAVSASLLAFGLAAPASATTTDTFQAGNIISDQNFFDPNAMSAAQIQAFLSSEIAGCTTGNCLNILAVATTSHAASYTAQGNLICNPYAGSPSESAATVIYKVQQACSVSAKAILVTLQKEQGLVTKTAVTAATLARAMGYGCPDSAAGACDTTYYGFFNQVYLGARELRRYGTPTVAGNFQPGVRFVQYSPVVACGGTNVNILDRATAALYNYTPYQPNAAAIRNMFSTGDSCSSYGNRNFWGYYNSWFGDPTVPAGTPEANLNAVTFAVRTVTVSGWSVDPDAVTGAVPIAVQIDGNWYATTANVPGADLSAQYPGAGGNHYFTGTFPATAGDHTLCVYLVNAGGGGGLGSLGCQAINVPSAPAPVGALNATASNGVISFTGWALRPDAPTAPVQLASAYGNVWTGYTTGLPNSDAKKTVPAAGLNQGFAGSFAAPPGPQTFCIWGIPTTGPAVQFLCTTVTVPAPPAAVTNVNSITGAAGTVSVTGWAVNPSAPAQAVSLALQIDSSWYAVSTGVASTEPLATIATAGPNQGFASTVAQPAGAHTACVWVAEPSGVAVSIGCKAVTVTAPAAAAAAKIDSIVGGAGSISVSGWAVYPDSPSAVVPLALQVGSNWYNVSTGTASTEPLATVPTSGPNQGFASSTVVAAGTYSACLWVAEPVGAAVNLGCTTVTVTSAAMQSHIDSIVGGAGTISVAGWAVWPDKPTAAVNLAAQIGSQWYAVPAGLTNAESATAVPSAGAAHGFASAFPVAAGTYPVCLWAGTSAGGAVNIGCKTVVVSAPPVTQSHIDSITGGAGVVSVAGWAVWPDQPSVGVIMAVQVGNNWTQLTANAPSTEAAAAVPAAGANHGFTGSVPLSPGPQEICIWALASAGGAINLGCTTVTVLAPTPPKGSIDSVTAAAGSVSVSGWALWPDQLATGIPMALQIDSNWYDMTANVPSAEAVAAVAGAGPNHGFSLSQATTSGAHSVCVWVALSGGGAADLGCRAVTVP
jgi:hypothetical protein